MSCPILKMMRDRYRYPKSCLARNEIFSSVVSVFGTTMNLLAMYPMRVANIMFMRGYMMKTLNAGG